MKMTDDEEDIADMKHKVTDLLRYSTFEAKLLILIIIRVTTRSVPKLRVRYAGKTIPPEKYCCVRAEKYTERSEAMILPAFVSEFIHSIQVLSKESN